MATALSLWFLPFLLFFLMNGHGIGASRDLKVEMQDQKEVDSTNDEPNYLTGYFTTSKSTQPNYIASYTSKENQNHSSHHEKIDEAYITAYSTTPKSTQPDYKTTQIFKRHNHPSHHGEKINEPYITGYRTGHREVNEPYITGYNTGNHKINEPYITGYRTGDREVNEPYITGYRTSNREVNEPYITGYRTSNREVNEPYITGYKTNNREINEPYITGYRTSNREVNEPYITGYRTGNHDSKQDPKTIVHDVTNYDLHPRKNNSKESVDSNEPYITQYGDSGPKNDPKESAQDHNKPYVTSYGFYPKKNSKESTTQDLNEPYITQYGGTGPKNDPKEFAKDHDKPYITQYGNHDPKQDYAATYKRKQEESKGVPSSKVDHTEAFKTGFFSLDDVYVGNIMTLQFPVQEFSHFLPRKEADSIPFSTSQLPSVLQLFSISEDSPMAKSMRGTLEQCEAETITGETKICANSLESMIEFVSTIIGSDAKYDILTTSHPTPSATPLQKYTILEVSKDIYAPKWVACHPLPYPYAVYYCHFIATGSKVFKVSLSGENGDKMEALGICHLDTSEWSPDHIIFKQLGFMPGEAPVCHYFPVKHLMWVPQPLTATM